jgi:hypothetical protein
MSCATIRKAAADVLDFDFDFTRWMPEGDRIIDTVVDIEGSTAAVTDIDQSDTVSRVWISGGDLDDRATVTVTITTLLGRVKQVAATLIIKGC